MSKVLPFKAVRYDKAKVRDIARVVAPPYDIIPERLQDELYRADPHNIVRLILNKITSQDTVDDNRYTRSKKFLDSWLDEGVLAPDSKDSFYIYSQEYECCGRKMTQTGFIGLMSFDPTGEDKVMPHENTLAAPKEDRLKLIRSVRANLSPIFILYEDGKVTKVLKDFSARNKPVIDIEWGGVRHKVWKADDPATARAIGDNMEKSDLFIADGHHRYEVAKMFAREDPENPRSLMVYFVQADEEQLTVLPAHRLIKDLGKTAKSDIIGKLEPYFDIEKAAGLDKMMSRLAALSKGHTFGLYAGGSNFYILKLKDTAASDAVIKDKPEEWKRLDVSILHLFIFQHVLGVEDTDDNIEFMKDPAEAARAVDGGSFEAALFLNPTKVSQIKRIAKLGERMPRKATYFYPKQLSGLVINKF